MELVYDLCRTRQKNTKKCFTYDIGHIDKKTVMGSKPREFDFLDTLNFENENCAKAKL